MTAQIYISKDLVGEVTLKVIDKSMGVVGGDFVPNQLYDKYQIQMQKLTEEFGISYSSDFDITAKLDGRELQAEGGIGITDSIEFDERLIEICGIHWEIVDRII